MKKIPNGGLVSKLTGFLKGSLKTAPVLFGVAAPFVMPAPSGNTILGRLKNGDIEGAFYDGREMFIGVDANGQVQIPWLIRTYAPAVIGGIVKTVVDEVL